MNIVDEHIAEEKKIREIINSVPDPEVPVLTIDDLGIIRSVQVTQPAQRVEIIITPTYSGCPAMDVIRMHIRMLLLKEGYSEIKISTVLSPAWTTEWMSEAGKQKLKSYGIAPPGKMHENKNILFEEKENVQCPLCNSFNTRLISEFGSTACKSLYQCNDCGEPFDYFKCH